MSSNNKSEIPMSSPHYICTNSDAFPKTEEEFLEDKRLHDELYPEDDVEEYKEHFLIRLISLLTGKA